MKKVIEMAKKSTLPEENLEKRDRELAQKLHSLGIAYRVLLVLGMLLSVAITFLAVLTVRVTIWYMAVPVVIFLLGLILARMEYNLFRNS